MAQAEFDRQCEITRLLLEGISSTHVSIHRWSHHTWLSGFSLPLIIHDVRKFMIQKGFALMQYGQGQ